MKCSESPITSSVPDTQTTAGAGAPAREEAADVQAFEAVLASSIMKPLAESLGPVGSFVTEAIATAAIDRARSEGIA